MVSNSRLVKTALLIPSAISLAVMFWFAFSNSYRNTTTSAIISQKDDENDAVIFDEEDNNNDDDKENDEPQLSFYNATLEKEIETEQNRRQSLLNDICSAYYGPPRPLDSDVALLNALLQSRVHMVNEKYKILVCLNYKVGTTNLLNYLIQISESLTESYAYNRSLVNRVHSRQFHSQHIKWLLHYDRQTASQILEDPSYTRVMFVRDPLQRIVSSWRDKLTELPTSQANRQVVMAMAADIIETIRPNASRREIDEQAIPVSLQDLFTYLAVFDEPPALLDYHWRPYLHNCLPCRYRYDFIGHLENFGPEMEFLARQVTGETTVPKVPLPPGRFRQHRDALKDVKKEIVRQALKRFYVLDYALFGYDLYFDD